MLCAPVEVEQHPLAVALLVVVLALIGVFLAFGEHGVDQSGQFMSGGGGGDGARAKSMRELKRRKYAPSADWLERKAAAAGFKACLARSPTPSNGGRICYTGKGIYNESTQSMWSAR